ncbi:MAG: bifunctional UDP-N-acetylglucosamine diphosphorylase/glucosamine-1-phosphate N-acetyltransferase GlmU [Solirubrobacterales bacterium]|nr:bifunctional UDP-N-acetylglucosamine diphosphorylase/glucosamine-1-phosphate N-acetyltransferase GlmU [Solirubrobacterales bacterium]
MRGQGAATACLTTRSGSGCASTSQNSSHRARERSRRWNSICPVSAPIVLILAAGQGTRMRSQTPKVLHELCGRPMVLWPVQAALAAGAGRVVVVDSPARALEPVLPEGVELAVQAHPDGTGGAVAAGMAALEESTGSAIDPGAPVLVLSGDVPLVSAEAIGELIDAHAACGAAATMATTFLEDPSGYGRVVRDRGGAVERVVETKGQGDSTQAEREIREVNTGIFVFAARALREALPRLSAENAQGELYLPQVLELLRSGGALIGGHNVEDDRLVLGVNDRVSLARVRKLAQAAINERHMLAGVSIVDPDATVIDVDVEIGQDTLIEPFTTIRGTTRIGSGCTIRHSYLVDCVLEDGAAVGPFAYLRPGTVLRSGAKVGTFVEVKNSDIGAGAKVPHLSYIGDADVGERSNLGAATITANYDGRAKHRTRIGSGVRTGVDTTLVAPVTVGDGAYTGAGSVITEDVPPGALGIARERQRNVEGFVERREGAQ